MLKTDVVEARLNHCSNYVSIGSTADGSLRLFDEPTGLRFELDLETTACRKWSVLETLQAGRFAGASVKYRVRPEWCRESGRDTFTIVKATLIEVSLLERPLRPAARGTSVRLELGCTNCRREHVHLAADKQFRCNRCGMRYERPY